MASGKGLDAIDVFIRNLHLILGHEKTAAYLGVPVGDKGDCSLCQAGH